MTRLWVAVLLMPLVLGLAACDLVTGLIEEDEPPPLPGRRISVLTLDRSLEPDPRLADTSVHLPRPVRNPDWPQNGGYPDHAMHHLEVGDTLSEAWRADVGTGSDDELKLIGPPTVAAGRVYAIDAEGLVSAFNAVTGALLWEVETNPEDEDDGGLGGGLAFADGLVFVTTGFGEVIALEAANGRTIWRRSVGHPMRAPPTVDGRRVFAITYDNHLFALDSGDGSVLWEHAGIVESAAMLGAASPAVEGDIAVVPFSSGELVALRVENGRVLWSDTLMIQTGMGALAALNDIKGSPVIDKGTVYAISHGGRLVAIDLRTGARQWDREISGLQTPWIAGDFLYVVAADGDVICIARESGRIRWVVSLPRFEDPVDRDDPVFWSGPALVSDRLIVVGSMGDAVAISPYTGRLLGRIGMPDGVLVPPVVADGTLYILTEDADLIALR